MSPFVRSRRSKIFAKDSRFFSHAEARMEGAGRARVTATERGRCERTFTLMNGRTSLPQQSLVRNAG
jgi:hypothetical protein